MIGGIFCFFSLQVRCHDVRSQFYRRARGKPRKTDNGNCYVFDGTSKNHKQNVK